MQTLWIALTGGIGSGKSTAARLFADLGVPVLSADAIAAELTACQSPILSQIADILGDEVFDQTGCLNRKATREIIFRQPKKKQQLEKLLHPLIFDAIAKQQQQTPCPHGYGMVEIPLLPEQPYFRQLVDRVLWIHADRSVRIARAARRDQTTPDAIARIVAHQADDAVYRNIADDIADNSHDGCLEHHIRRLHAQYRRDCPN